MGKEEVDLVTVAKPQEKKSLLQKYDIPVEHLSYEYLEGCPNVKELERILLVLRSGEEGIFPDLIRHGEKCLRELSPNSKVLRVEVPILTRAMLEPEDRKLIDDDMTKWMEEMHGREKDLEEGKELSSVLSIPQPEIRQAHGEIAERSSGSSRIKRDKPKSISSCDYEGWDKFDADAELDRIDLRDERNKVQAKNSQREQREKFERAKTFTRESIVDKLSLTATELVVMAEQEKNIGNEAYRAGDYEEALTRYTSSIGINSSVNAHNNRAITNIKLQRYRDAVQDCNLVLTMEYDNVTALMRRGLALEHLGKQSEALVDYQTILKLEPNNKIAIAGVNKLRKTSDSKKVRMKIEEQEDNEVGLRDENRIANEERIEDANYDASHEDLLRNGISEICFCDRAPGFSKNPKIPPHYKSSYCLSSSGGSASRQSKSQNSYFSDVETKNPRDLSPSRKLIIEELPNDECGEGAKNLEERFERKVGTGEEVKRKPKPKPKPVTSGGRENTGVASKCEKPSLRTQENIIPQDSRPVKSPYEFLRVWQSLKIERDYSTHEKLLMSVAPEDLDTVIGDKLDGDMLSLILGCLDSIKDKVSGSLVHRYMTSLTELGRFSIVSLFIDSGDKLVLKRILDFLEEKTSRKDAKELRKAFKL